ncbi:extracellular solute-binding protein [Tyzzerella sp. OttesenSCG-928-J15]|nr:extracellular solute-binding protein [Tyzzerella sp. OttesenSCG-928-J15]
MKNKYLYLAAIFVALVIFMSSCAMHNGEAGNKQDVITLDWYINFSWFTGNWDDNGVTRAITDNTGVKINFITPSGNEWEKLDSMINSGSLPDLITLGQWEPKIKQMIKDGQVYALNQLAEEYNTYFFQVANPQRLAWYTEEDSNVYAYPNSSYTPEDYAEHDNIGSNQSFLVRGDIYEAIGAPDMSTPEGFKQAIRDAVEMFPEVSGLPLIPVGMYDFDKDGCFSLEGMLMNMLAVPFEKDGKFYDRHTDADYIKWLKIFRELYEEGYMPAEVFVDRRMQTAEKVSVGRYFCVIYQHTDIAEQQIILHNNEPGSEYIAIEGPKNSVGEPHTLPGVGINGWTVTMISKNCKNPEKALNLMAYMMSEEGQKLTYCGVKGITYDEVNGEIIIKPEVQELLNKDRAEYNRLYGADNTYWMLQDNAMQLKWAPEQSGPLAQPKKWTYPYTVYAAQYDMVLDTDSAVANAHYNIREEWGKVLPKLIMAESEAEFDRIFGEYLAKREDLGFEMVMEEFTRQMAANKARLNITD